MASPVRSRRSSEAFEPLKPIYSKASQPLCWLKRCLPPTTRLVGIAATAKLEIIRMTYFSVVVTENFGCIGYYVQGSLLHLVNTTHRNSWKMHLHLKENRNHIEVNRNRIDLIFNIFALCCKRFSQQKDTQNKHIVSIICRSCVAKICVYNKNGSLLSTIALFPYPVAILIDSAVAATVFRCIVQTNSSCTAIYKVFHAFCTHLTTKPDGLVHAYPPEFFFNTLWRIPKALSRPRECSHSANQSPIASSSTPLA